MGSAILSAPGSAAEPELVLQTGPTYSVSDVSFSGDGRYFATSHGGYEGRVLVWELSSGRIVRDLAAHKANCSSLALSADASRVLSGSSDNTAVYWDTATGDSLFVLKHEAPVTSVAISPDRTKLLTGDNAHTAHLWDAATGQKLHTLKHAGAVRAVVFSRDGRQCATAGEVNDTACRSGYNGEVVIWESDTGREVRRLKPPGQKVNSIAFSHDGKSAFGGGGSYQEAGGLIEWNATTGEIRRQLPRQSGEVLNIALSPDGQQLLSSAAGGKVALWNLATGEMVREWSFVIGDTSISVSATCFTPDGKHVFLAPAGESTYGFHDLQTGERVRSLEGVLSPAVSAAFSSDGRSLVVGGYAIYHWEAGSDNPPRKLDSAGTSGDFSLSADGSRIAVKGYTKGGKSRADRVAITDTASGHVVSELKNLPDSISSMAVSPDLRWIATHTFDFDFKQSKAFYACALWDVAADKKLCDLPCDSSSDFQSSADGQRLLQWDYKKAVLWDVPGQKELARWQSPGYLATATLSRNGRRVLLADDHKSFSLFDTASGARVVQWDDPGAVLAAVFSPNGRTVVSGRDNGEIHAWVIGEGPAKQQFVGNSSAVHALQVSPGGRYLVSGSRDGAVRLWDFMSGRLLATIYVLAGDRGWLAFADGRVDGTPEALKLVARRTGPLSVEPIDANDAALRAPGLLHKVWQAEELTAVAAKPPQVRIVEPSSGVIDSLETTVEIAATDEGSSVGSMRLLHNGNEVTSTAEIRRAGKSYSRAVNIKLAAGENRLQAIAETLDGDAEARSEEMLVRYQKPPEALARDKAVIEFVLPATAQLAVDGRAYGAKRELAYQPIVPGRSYHAQVSVVFADGSTQRRVVTFSGGQKIQVAISDPHARFPEAVLQLGHREYVKALAFSANGTRLFSGGDDGLVIEWDVATGRQRRAMHTLSNENIRGIDLSPNGELLAIASDTPSLSLRDTNSGREVRAVAGKTRFQGVAFTPDGKKIIGADSDGNVSAYDVATGQPLYEFVGLKRDADTLAMSRETGRLVTGGHDTTADNSDDWRGELVLWDSTNGKKLSNFAAPAGEIDHVAISSDGRRIASISDKEGESIRLWDADSGKQVATLVPEGDNRELYCVAFSRDGRRVYGGKYDVSVWNAETGKLQQTIKVDGILQSLLESPDGKTLVVAGADGRIEFFDLPSGTRRRRLPGAQRYTPVAEFSPDGRLLLTAMSDKTVCLWDAASGRLAETFTPTYDARSPKFSPDGAQILLAGGNASNTVTLIDRLSGRQRNATASPLAADAEFVAWDPSGQRFVAALRHEEYKLVLCSAADGREIRSFPSIGRAFRGVQFRRDGRHILSTDDSGQAIIWDAETGQQVRTFGNSDDPAKVAAYSHDGRRIVSGGYGWATLWNADSGTSLGRLETGGYVPCVAFDPSGQFALTCGGETHEMQMWDVASRTRIKTFSGHEDEIMALAVRPDGRQALTSSRDGTSRLWDLATGDELMQLVSLGNGSEWIALTPQGVFDASAESTKQIVFRQGDKLEPSPPEFMRREKLLAAIWKGERPQPDMSIIARGTPPITRILSPLASAADAPEVELAIEVTDQGGGHGDLEVLHNGSPLPLSAAAVQGATRKFTTPARLVIGRNAVRAISRQKDGYWQAPTAEVSLFYDPPLKQPEPPPAGTCEVELSAPTGATVIIDGRDYGAKRFFAFPSLQPGRSYASQIVVKFADGSQATRGITLASGQRVRVAFPGKPADRPELVIQGGHSGSVISLAYSPDGRYLVTGSDDHSAILWDVATWKKLRAISHGNAHGMDVAFSADGQTLATHFEVPLGGLKGRREVAIWDLVSGLRKQTLPAEYGIYSFYEAVTGRKFRPADLPQEIHIAVRKSGDGSRAITATNDNNVLVWDPATGQAIKTVKSPADLTCAEISPDGKLLALGMSQFDAPDAPGLGLWEIDGGQSRILSRDNVDAVAFSPDGKRLAVGNGPAVELWDVTTGQRTSRWFGHTRSVEVLTFSPDGRQLVSGSGDHRAIVRDAQSGEILRVLVGASSDELATGEGGVSTARRTLDEDSAALSGAGRGGIVALEFGPGGRTLLAGGFDGTPVVWDMRSAQLAERLTSFNDRITDVAISRNGRWLASIWPNRSAVLTDRWTGLIRTLPQPADGNALAFSPDSAILAAAFDGLGDEKGGIVLRETTSGRELRTLRGHTSQITDLGFSPDGSRLLTASMDNSAIVWNVQTGAALLTIPASEYGLRAAEFSPNGRELLTAQGFGLLNPPGMLTIWDSTKGRKLREVEASVGSLYAARYSPDGTKILTGADENAAILWDARSLQKIRTLSGHTDCINVVAFRPDGRVVATGSADGTVRLWDLDTGDELAQLVSLDGGQQWLVNTPEGLFDGSTAGREQVHFRVGGGLNVVPVDRFFQDFYRPGLLLELSTGARPLPGVELGQSVPPKVRIVAPAIGGRVEQQRVTLEIEVADQGGGIRGPWLFQNGARVLPEGTSQRTGRSVTLRCSVALIEGVNEIAVHASNADGSWESEPTRLTFSYEQPLDKPELYLLAVGIGQYADESLQLKFARGDAEAFSKLFGQRSAGLYERAHLLVLADKAATREGILAAIAQLAAKARPQDTIAVALSGHGAVVSGNYFFLPQEFQRGDATVADAVRATGLPAADIGAALAATPALKRLLIFDTCQSGALANARTGRNPFALRGAIERLGRSEGTFTIAAVADGGPAREVPELGHGMLSYSLLAGLRAVDGGPLSHQWIAVEDEEPVADVLGWFSFASARAPQLMQRYFGQQQEVQYVAAGASFPVLPIPGGKPLAPADPTHVTTLEPQRPDLGARVIQANAAGKGELHLMAIGVNQYRTATMNLKYAARDAQAIADLFTSRGPALFSKLNIRTLVDAQATREGILNAVADTARNAKPEDTLIVFAAGHGAMVGQRYYFLPHDLERKAEMVADDIRAGGLPADELGEALAKVPARQRMLILDTCASGGALQLARGGVDPFSFRGAIERLGQDGSVFTIAASAAADEAQEIDALGHGLLTYCLLAGLNAVDSGPLAAAGLHGNRPDGLADVLEWFSYASGQVPRVSRDLLGIVQEVQSSGHGASFVVLPLRGTKTRP